LLRQAGLKFFAIPPDYDEAPLKKSHTGSPQTLALALAAGKAAMVAGHYPESLVIGADQMLVCEGERFDKPVSREAAAAQLRFLSGRIHTLITAVCIHQGGVMLWSDIAEARLTMRPLSEPFITQYIEQERDHICATVGAYRLEGPGAQLFSAVEGDFFTILGLNLLPLLGFLRDEGVLPA
jgi:septum formation protein